MAANAAHRASGTGAKENKMQYTQKTFKRASKASANKTMDAYEAKMKENGWEVTQQFGGDAGCSYKVTTYFAKQKA